MKLNGADLEKIARYEQKRGINYARTKGRLYRRLLVFGFLAWIYMMLMVLFYILGRAVEISEDAGRSDNIFITIFTAFIITFLSPFIYGFLSKTAGLIINLLAVPVLAAAFIKISLVNESISSSGSTISEYDPGFFGLKKLFFWRNGIPMLAVFTIAIILLIIIIRERVIIKREFETISNNSYTEVITGDE